MLRVLICLLSLGACFAADDPWDAVRAVKSGSDLRIFKVGSAQPVLAKMNDLTDTSLIVVVKNEQVAIPRDQIERIDARPPAKAGQRLTKETHSSKDNPPPDVASPKPHQASDGSSYSSNVGFQSKPDFQTVYRRTASSAKPRE